MKVLAKKFNKLVRKGILRMGIYPYGANITWPWQSDFKQVRVAVASEEIPGIPDDRCFVLYRLSKSIANVPGDVMECGCRYGKSARFIMAGLGDDSVRHLRIFDSFEGLSEPTSEDKQANSGEAVWSSGDLAVVEQELMQNLRSFEDRVHIHKGWIPEKFPEVEEEVFALVHIDVDLYQPTLDTLEFVYDKVLPRGVIVCDDYGSKSCPGARKAVDEFFANRPENVLELTNMQALVVKADV